MNEELLRKISESLFMIHLENMTILKSLIPKEKREAVDGLDRLYKGIWDEDDTTAGRE